MYVHNGGGPHRDGISRQAPRGHYERHAATVERARIVDHAEEQARIHPGADRRADDRKLERVCFAKGPLQFSFGEWQTIAQPSMKICAPICSATTRLFRAIEPLSGAAMPRFK